MRKLESAISDAASTNTKVMHNSKRLIVSSVCTRKRGKYQEARCAMLTGVLAVPRRATRRPPSMNYPRPHRDSLSENHHGRHGYGHITGNPEVNCCYPITLTEKFQTNRNHAATSPQNTAKLCLFRGIN